MRNLPSCVSKPISPSLTSNYPRKVALKCVATCISLLLLSGAPYADEHEAHILECDLPDEFAKPRSTDDHIHQVSKETVKLWQSLDAKTLGNMVYCLGDPEMYSWTNIPGRRSGGIRFGALNEEQQEQAWNILRAFMSDRGFAKIHFLATEIEPYSRAGPVADYTLAIFGNPKVDSSWGVQLDGHHIALNFLVHGNDVAIAPMFIGARPLTLNGESPLENEISLGRELYDNLDADQKKRALIPGLVRGDVIVGSGSGQRDRGRNFNYSAFDGVGLPISDLSNAQAAKVVSLAREYVDNLQPTFAERVWNRIESQLDQGFFTYSQLEDRVYYRIYSKDSLLIEYDDVARDHLHTVLRLLNEEGLSDYGPFVAEKSDIPTLFEHYHGSDHHQTRVATSGNSSRGAKLHLHQ